MTLKTRIIVTVAWTVLTFIIAGVGIWYIGTHPIRGVRAEARAAKLGTGVGTLASIGYAVIWLPYAAKIGQEKRKAREAQQKKRKRKS